MLRIELSGKHGDFGDHLSEVPWVVTLVLVRPYGQGGLSLLDGRN
jgi:hypothetical protein